MTGSPLYVSLNSSESGFNAIGMAAEPRTKAEENAASEELCEDKLMVMYVLNSLCQLVSSAHLLDPTAMAH